DREVNIKILLGRAIAAGDLERDDRNALLTEMTNEVGELVLRDNYLQASVLSIARGQARLLLPVHRRMFSELERRGLVDRALEAVAEDDELAARGTAGVGLSSPELAVLLAYTKIALKRDLDESGLCDDDWTEGVVTGYFPTLLRERFADQMAGHQLRREIVSTTLANE